MVGAGYMTMQGVQNSFYSNCEFVHGNVTVYVRAGYMRMRGIHAKIW